jgi:hypothetical protein
MPGSLIAILTGGNFFLKDELVGSASIERKMATLTHNEGTSSIIPTELLAEASTRRRYQESFSRKYCSLLRWID